jgi:hypothetical protein
MAAHDPRADLLAGQLIEEFLLMGDRDSGSSSPRARQFQLRINGVLGGIDADGPDVRRRKFPAVGGAPRPDRERAAMPLIAYVCRPSACCRNARFLVCGERRSRCRPPPRPVGERPGQ